MCEMWALQFLSSASCKEFAVLASNLVSIEYSKESIVQVNIILSDLLSV